MYVHSNIYHWRICLNSGFISFFTSVIFYMSLQLAWVSRSFEWADTVWGRVIVKIKAVEAETERSWPLKEGSRPVIEKVMKTQSPVCWFLDYPAQPARPASATVPLLLCGLVSPVAENPVTSTSTIIKILFFIIIVKNNIYYHYYEYPLVNLSGSLFLAI